MSIPRLRILTAAALITGLVIACGGGGGDEPSGTPDPNSDDAESSIDSYTDVQPAIIQIVSQGSFRDPEIGYANGAGAGSGFIISADGLAVTNNHVVAGAATIEVFIGGDDSKGYNANIIGVSECNDLALIDIREDEPLPFLDWSTDEIKAGLDIYVAGFPLGDPEFTLTRGIIAKAETNGETSWASIDYAIEHDAQAQPGNSGGPLVTADGRVVGIHYAGAVEDTATVKFAIPSTLAEGVIDKLKGGDFESIGVNGWAVYEEALDLSGIWVAGVAPGSAAAEAEIQAGDIIMSLNGLPMGTDGTMSDYCDVFRTSGDDKPMAVEVYRYDTGEILRGEINSDQPIEVVFSPAADLEDEVDVDSGTAYTNYISLYDDTNTLIVDVPVQWDDIATAPIEVDGQMLPYVAAATDLDAFINGFDTPGMQFVLFGPENVDDLLARYEQSSACTDGGIYEYSDPVFTGAYQIWENCGDNDTITIVLAAVPEDGAYTAFMIVGVVTDADFDALDQLFATFNVLQ